MFRVNLLTFVRCSLWPLQVLSWQGETHESAGDVVDIVLSVRKRWLVSFENATARVIEDLFNLAGLQSHENVGEIFALISLRRLRGDSVRWILRHDETEIVGLQLVVGLLGSQRFAVLALPFSPGSPWYSGHGHQFAFVGRIDHDFSVDGEFSTIRVSERC